MRRRSLLSATSVTTIEEIIPRESKIIEPTSSRDQWENLHRYPTLKINRLNSPTLAHLRSKMDKGRQSGYVNAAQKELMKKHHEAKSRVHSVSGVGGGVSMWPSMDDMRLARGEANRLVIFCGVLILGTMSVFLACHGEW